MIENEQHNNNNAAMENNTEPITKANNMKCGQFQAINNTVCYHQMSFNIALILEQVSNNNLLRQQVSMEKASCRGQNNMNSKDNIFKSRMFARENEHMPKGLDDKNMDKDRKVTNNCMWNQPKKCMPITCFLKHAKLKKSWRRIIINTARWQIKMRMTSKKKKK